MGDEQSFAAIGRAFVAACFEEAKKRGYPAGIWTEQGMVAKVQLCVKESWERVDAMPTYAERKRAKNGPDSKEQP